MGREYRFSRNPRLRQARDRRPAGVPDALSVAHCLERGRAAAGPVIEQPPAGQSCRQRSSDRKQSSGRKAGRRFAGSLAGPFSGAFVGIDVGENFLDLAIIGPTADALVFKRVGLDGLDESPCARLAQRISAAAPLLDARATALVDSPRWPRDLDCSDPARRRDPVPHGREIDVELRRTFLALTAARADGAPRPGLSMFPTPPLSYFARCARDPRCKPHLKAIARELFDSLWLASETEIGRAHV